MKDLSTQYHNRRSSFLSHRQRVMAPLRSIFLSVLVGIALFGVGLQVTHAQSVEVDHEVPSTWSENVGDHFAETLRNPVNEQMRGSAMRLIIRLKATHGEAIDLSACAPVLLDLTTTAETESQRILAITALYETGDLRSLQALAEQVRMAPPSRVRDHAVRILAVHRAAN